MIDLHSHSTASDGTLTPTELVCAAKEAGLSALGLTDHDTVGGLEEATAAAGEIGLELVPGIEISVDYPSGEFHLLGYYVDFHDQDFLSRVTELHDRRASRNAVMVRKMQEAGFNVTMEDVLAEAGGGEVGRPHMAQALVRKGYASSIQDAFERFVGNGKPLHVPKVRLTAPAAVSLVHSARGVAVLAHPKFLRFQAEEELEGELTRLKECGLDGLECYYSKHTEEETARYLRLAERLGFVVTAGSDFHGARKPEKLGEIYQGRGGEEALLAELKAAARRR